MGEIIDTTHTEEIYRCNHVKIYIVYINLIGAPISLIFLLFGIVRMVFYKKRITLLSSFIILIFSSEVVNCFSKLFQLLKYQFDDSRMDRRAERDNPRGIICQIQICTSIFSDLCSLLTSLLISLRCYDVIKNRHRFFDKSKNGIKAMLLIIIISICLSIGFLFLDRNLTKNNPSYRYDLRDRCSYWCWVDHSTSLICFSIYIVILIFNIIFACKTNYYLKRGYQKLKEESSFSRDLINNDYRFLKEGEKDNSKKNLQAPVEKKYNLTKEEKKRIEELRLMKLKCLIYPFVTITIWTFAAIYRVIDDRIMIPFDEDDNPEEGTNKEKDYFNDHPIIQFFVQFFLVLHTIISAIRGIFYGISFIVFEEKLFSNFLRKLCKCCYKDKDLEDESNNPEVKIETLGMINNNSLASDNIEKNNEDIIQNNEDINQNNEEEDDNNDISNDGNIELNTSDYHYSNKD